VRAGSGVGVGLLSDVGESSELDLGQLWRDLAFGKGAIVLCLAVGALLGLLVAVTSERTYRSEVLITPVEDESQIGPLSGTLDRVSGLASLAGIDLGGGSSNREVVIATLTSRAFTVEFIEQNDLLPVLFHERWDPLAKNWRVESNEIPTFQDAWDLFDQDVRSVSESEDGLLSLAIEWRDPQAAAQWANALVDRVNERVRQQAIREASESIGYLNAEAEKTSVLGVQQAIYRLVETQVNKIMLANVRKQYAFRVIDPAVPSDPDRFIWPNYALLLGAGTAAGGCLGALISLILARRAARSAPHAP
jgi:uncharacterized protein involved in exopolysaccharide biosynthesis